MEISLGPVSIGLGSVLVTVFGTTFYQGVHCGLSLWNKEENCRWHKAAHIDGVSFEL